MRYGGQCQKESFILVSDVCCSREKNNLKLQFKEGGALISTQESERRRRVNVPTYALTKK